MGQSEFRCRLDITAGAGGDFENTKGIERQEAAHGPVIKLNR
jgi:hypothetical protein